MGQDKFETLDGMRGVAALLVLGFHAFTFEGRWVLGHGYLAVDFFFILSGFVVAHAYEDRLRGGMGFVAFARRRLLRLQPTHLIGCALALATALCLGAGAMSDPARLVRQAIAAALYIPELHGAGYAFPLNDPAWSLAWEIVASLGYALCLPYLSDRALRAILAVAGALLVFCCLVNGDASFGSSSAAFLVGAVRVSFAFPAGLLLHRLHRQGKLARWAGRSSGVLLATLAFLLCLPASLALSGVVDAALLLVGFPILAAMAVGARCETASASRYRALATLSFPLYAVHAPVLSVTKRIITLGGPPLLTQALGVVLSLAVGGLVAHRVEPRVRRALSDFSAGLHRLAGQAARA